MRFLLAAAVVSAFAVSPASAAMMKCTSDNMMKSTSMMMTMPESPGKMAANKEIGMANTDMSMGKMGSACGALHEGAEGRDDEVRATASHLLIQPRCSKGSAAFSGA